MAAVFDLAESWQAALEDELKLSYMNELQERLLRERRAGKIVYPSNHDICAALRETPLSKVRIVIVGQDPYHGENQAEGLAFSVKRGVPIPPSLKNIYKELKQDLNLPLPTQGSLLSWARQGVLLLNSVLTVREGEPASHADFGWERFTDVIIRAVAKKEEPVVFMLWGKFAQKKALHILGGVERSHALPHALLLASHPSPLSVRGFLGCRHFSKANAYLREWGFPEIDWRIE